MVCLDAYNPWTLLGSRYYFNNDITDLAADWYVLCQYIGIAGFFFSLVGIGIRLALVKGKSGEKLEKIKEDLAWKSMIIILIASFPWVVGTIYGLAISFR